MNTEVTALAAKEFVGELFEWKGKAIGPSQIWPVILSKRATWNGLRAVAKEMYYGAMANPRQCAAMLSYEVARETFLRMAENFSREAGYYETPNPV